MRIRSFAFILLFVATLVVPQSTHASELPPPLRFEHLSLADGLPDNTIRTIIQDHQGFLWLGTHAGLVRFDGYEMKVFLPNSEVPTSIGGRIVNTLIVDNQGDLWIGTLDNGVSRYCMITGKFTHWSPDVDSQSGKISGRTVRCLFEDHDGTILVGFIDSPSLSRIDPVSKSVETIKPPPDQAIFDTLALFVDRKGLIWSSSSSGEIIIRNRTGEVVRKFFEEFSVFIPNTISIKSDHQDRVLILGQSLLGRYDPLTEEFEVWSPGMASDSNQHLRFTEMVPAEDGSIWITADKGLFQLNPADGSFILNSHDPNRKDSLPKAPSLSLYFDQSGILWVGTWHSGLYKHNPSANRFQNFSANPPSNQPSLPIDAVSAITVDSSNRLWVGEGTLSVTGPRGGLCYLDRQSRAFSSLTFPDTLVRAVVAMAETSPDSLWLGTNLGVWLCLPKENRIVRPMIDSRYSSVLKNRFVRSMIVDDRGHPWICIQGWGVVDMDPDSGICQFYKHNPNDPKSLSQNTIPVILNDSSGRLWFGTDMKGLNLFDPQDGSFQRYFDPQKGLVNVTDLLEGPNGQLWIGTIAGLLEFDPHSGEIVRSIGRAQGLPNDMVSSILADEMGHLWLSTGRGIVDFDPGTEQIRIFDQNDGLPSDEAYFAHFNAADGTLYFGGKKGLLHFHPKLVQRRNTFTPPVVLTEIRLFDQSLVSGPESWLKASPTLASKLTLPWNQNHLTFAFASLDYSRPERNEYRFKLENHDQNWRRPGSDRHAVYTNLNPGHFRFRVQATNSEGIWSENEAVLTVTIHPPWWKTPWALVAYVLIGLIALLVTFRLSTRRIKRAADLKIRLMELRKLRELDKIKSRFFANISHEFRTPLTLIRGPLAKLQQDPNSGDGEVFSMMHRNTLRLGQLIDQLLDLSRLESRRFPLNWQPMDVFGQLRVLCASFQSLADEKGVSYNTKIPQGHAPGLADPDLLEKVVGNLLINAIKFTPLGEKIWLEVEIGTEKPIDQLSQGVRPKKILRYQDLNLKVGNTGSFIPPEEQAKIFERFYQMAESMESSRSGSGIGLALTKELVVLLGGRISVHSSQNEGTIFSVTLPLYFSDTPVPMDTPDALDSKASLLNITAASNMAEQKIEEQEADSRPLLLVVEDDSDLRAFLFDILRPQFRIVLAEDGDEGVEAAFTEVPDLIISDVMMPGRDGFALCSAIKKDERTSHIPVILLTARTESESRITGYRTGADSYLAKPFEPEELLAQIQNLIAQRNLLRKRFAQSAKTGVYVDFSDQDAVVPAHAVFIQRIGAIAKEGIEDGDFTVAKFSREVGMSRSQLHRKLVALTGLSASAFLRSVRLQKAAELLKSGYGNVTEVAYATGHKSLSHFSKIFKEEFGVSPSEYPPQD